MKAFIDPVRIFGNELATIEKPARYIGGEVDAAPPIEPEDTRLRIALCFPDLYEIGMSNNALRILYSEMLALRDKVVCERVFAPAPDFEALLRKRNIPLYTLESGIPLHQCDVIAFSVGYELLATNMLAVLNCGYIPLHAEDRGDEAPLVIAGGPALTNPHPFGAFIDAAWIGEAEAGFLQVIEKLAGLKQSGASRIQMLSALAEHPSVWISPAIRKKLNIRDDRRIRRSIFGNFSYTIYRPLFPIPVLSPVQNHGTVEIMRGCPNGCRFCHAGYFYRPQRAKPAAIIEQEVEMLVQRKGYREITLASLSSGDYPGILELFERLNKRWSEKRISFQLPSLKVESFTLTLLEKISEVRKSGLTFAVETPVKEWQHSMNKDVPLEKVLGIIEEAVRKGFRSAKFYFMIGLPVPGRGLREAEEIAAYLARIAKASRMTLHVNVGTFVPKPHTPFERESQLGEQDALETIKALKSKLRAFRNISLSYHHPFLSVLEGILSRGDSRVAEIIEMAYSRGARLDAWEEHFDWALWRKVLQDFNTRAGESAWEQYLAEKNQTATLPWNDISLGISKKWIERQQKNAMLENITPICSENCTDPCGICNTSTRIVSNSILSIVYSINSAMESVSSDTENSFVQVFLIAKWSKTGKAVYYPLHAVSSSFSRAFQMAGLEMAYTEGFNPQPKIELTPPLSLGIEGYGEVLKAVILLKNSLLSDEISSILASINNRLPQGLRIESLCLKPLKKDEKKRSLASLFHAAEWTFEFFTNQSWEEALNLVKLHEKDLISWRISDESSRTISIVEHAPAPDRKIFNVLKRLREHFSTISISEASFKATRIACLSFDAASGSLLPLEEAL
ncbi:MAG: TIGR03960 family B12-binding radical SAM protein [Spirochaetales bacterium]|nr:TIGR03960 family B12-binding radical SAM protein [Spirochaetales bacterium]